MPTPHVLIAINTSWNIVNFRAGLVRGLQEGGYRVSVAAPRDRFTPDVERLGCRFFEMPLQGHGRSPAADLGYLARMRRLLRRERPTALLGYTVKPNIYGSLAAHSLGIPVVNNVAGLGLMFNERGASAKIVVGLYRIALRRSRRVFFQNPEDLALFTERGLVRPAQAGLLPGSGVDLARFAPVQDRRRAGDPFIFLLVGRLLREKGLAELAAASRRVRERHPNVVVRVLGPIDPANPLSVTPEQMDGWAADGSFEPLGVADDVRPHLAAADCVVLPSYYREGTPRALLEALAAGKPVITTTMPGCRDVVEDGVNGFLVPPRDIDALATRMADMVEMDAPGLERLGRASRARAETRFDEAIVVRRYLEELAPLVAGDVTRSGNP